MEDDSSVSRGKKHPEKNKKKKGRADPALSILPSPPVPSLTVIYLQRKQNKQNKPLCFKIFPLFRNELEGNCPSGAGTENASLKCAADSSALSPHIRALCRGDARSPDGPRGAVRGRAGNRARCRSANKCRLCPWAAGRAPARGGGGGVFCSAPRRYGLSGVGSVLQGEASLRFSSTVCGGDIQKRLGSVKPGALGTRRTSHA